MAAIEKFKLGGASATNIAVLVKNHCANETAQDGKKNNICLLSSSPCSYLLIREAEGIIMLILLEKIKIAHKIIIKNCDAD